jgi:7,8-dihydropterin-6-yl-methyl-4-(beta-D-ribofuranosyl)aminobenzene 5'-phosphate synthase
MADEGFTMTAQGKVFSSGSVRWLAGISLIALAALFGWFVAGLRAADPELELRVIYDNTSAREDVTADWGFATVVTFRGRRILFDSGTKPELFLENLRKMDVAPSSIEAAMISHEHRDHRSGIYRLYPETRGIPVHFLDAFPAQAYEEAAAIGLQPQRVKGPFEIVPGAHSTGFIEGAPPEQSLAIETSKGIVLIVGCSHPGIVKIVETVERQRGKDSIHLVLGGFHMFEQNAEQIQTQIRRLRELKVERVMPAHCSGDLAKQLFQEAYGDNFATLGAGKLLRIQ